MWAADCPADIVPAPHPTQYHDSTAFDCGDADLNTYLKRYARQNHESGAKCFVAVPEGAPSRPLGFYTLSPASLIDARTPTPAWINPIYGGQRDLQVVSLTGAASASHPAASSSSHLNAPGFAGETY